MKLAAKSDYHQPISAVLVIVTTQRAKRPMTSQPMLQISHQFSYWREIWLKLSSLLILQVSAVRLIIREIRLMNWPSAVSQFRFSRRLTSHNNGTFLKEKKNRRKMIVMIIIIDSFVQNKRNASRWVIDAGRFLSIGRGENRWWRQHYFADDVITTWRLFTQVRQLPLSLILTSSKTCCWWLNFTRQQQQQLACWPAVVCWP